MKAKRTLALAGLALAWVLCAAGAFGAEAQGAGPPLAQAGPVSVNSASAQELEGVLGLGPALAGRIVQYRAAHGPFKTLHDLLLVEGIGEAKLKRLETQIRL